MGLLRVLLILLPIFYITFVNAMPIVPSSPRIAVVTNRCAVTNQNPNNDIGTVGDPTRRQYSGPASNFPNPAKWQKFSLAWQTARAEMTHVDSASEIYQIYVAIWRIAVESKVDARVILAMIMQESSGNVRVPTSDNGVRNPGLMQSHNGMEFDPYSPAASILQMVRDGTEGTAYGDGMVQLINRYGNIYAALRGYNSGSVDASNLSNAFTSTSSYVSDIANRLMGATGYQT